MPERIWKVAFTLGLLLGILAIVLAFSGSSYSHESTGETGFKLNINIGSGDGTVSMILGAVSISLLVFGAAFLIGAKQANSSNKTRAFCEFLQKLHRLEADCKIAGVCGGLADGTPVPSWAWRMLFLVLTFCFGIGVLPYIILWICLPVQKTQAS